jgi:hypothetical protein
MIRFNSTNSTDVRDLMFAGVATGATNPCLGGFNRLLYPTVAALFAKFKVSQNSECASFMLLPAARQPLH